MGLLVEVLMNIALEMFVVNNNSCCGTLLEFEEGDWEQLQMGLGDIGFSWYNSDALSCEKNSKLDFYVI